MTSQKWTLNQRYDAYLVAFDIVSFSRNIDNPDGLLHDRDALWHAIKSTRLFPKAAAACFPQFLGDEFRLAFRQKGIQTNEVIDFAKEVFINLEEQGDHVPTIRGIFLQGTLTLVEFMGYRHLDGDLIYRAASWLDEAEEGELLSELEFHGFEIVQSESHGKAWKKAVSGRSIDEARPLRIIDHANGEPSYVLACALRGERPSQAATDRVKRAVETAVKNTRGNGRPSDELFSISPFGLIVAFMDDKFDRMQSLISSLRPHAASIAPGFAAAVSKGRLRRIKEKEFAENFEGSAAIGACRILAKLKPGDLAYTHQMREHKPLIAETVEGRVYDGKRGEKFEADVSEHFFSPASTYKRSGGKPTPEFGIAGTDGVRADSRRIREVMDSLSVSKDLRKVICDCCEGIPRSKEEAFLSVTSALLLSGNAVRDCFLAPAAKSADEHYRRFALNAVLQVVSDEIGLWKQFHSILGPLALYCKNAHTQIEMADPASLGLKLVAVINGHFNTQAMTGPSFTELCLDLTTNGLKRLSDNLARIGQLVDDQDIGQSCSKACPAELTDPARCESETRKVLASLKPLSEQLVRRLPKGLAHHDALVSLVVRRRIATQLAIDFLNAVFLLDKYIDGTFERLGTESPAILGNQQQMLRSIAMRIRPAESNAVVKSANDVILSWIDVLGKFEVESSSP